MSNSGEYSVELPPGFSHNNDACNAANNPRTESILNVGKMSHVYNTYDVALPPGFGETKKEKNKSQTDDVNSNKSYDVEMPPGFETKVNQNSYDVELPPNFNLKSEENNRKDKRNSNIYDEKQTYGPELPSGFKRRNSSSEEECDTILQDNFNVIGPLIPGKEIYEEFRHQKFSKESHPSKQKDAPRLKRDSWMVELPAAGAHNISGLKPRKFRTDSTPIDLEGRKAWLATPGEDNTVLQDEARREPDKWNDFKLIESQRRDRDMEDLANQYNTEKNRKDSLLDLHIKKRKKEKKKHKKNKDRSRSRSFSPTTAIPKRKMFDRDQDLAFHQMDAKTSKSYIAHTKAYASKFGHGEQKFL